MNLNVNKIRHPLVANSFYLYSAHFADYLLSFLILPFIARKLGPQSLGEVALAQTFGIFCLLFMEFGFSLTATRKVATLRENKEKLRSKAETAYHPSCTLKMGIDEMAVVDEKLKIHGLQNIRVVDASVMPEITSGNLNAPTLMIAEKASDLILNNI